MTAGEAFTRRSFEAWLHLRTFGSLVHFARVGKRGDVCAACRQTVIDLRGHFESECPVFAVRALVEQWDTKTCFNTPAEPRTFVAVLSSLEALLAAGTTTDEY